MKKFLIVALTLFISIAFAMPAMAKVQMGGMITLDFYYDNTSEELNAGGVAPGAIANADSRGTTNAELPMPLNRLNAKYTSDDGMIGGMIELRGGGARAATTGGAVWNYAYIDWRFNPSVYLRIGRQTQAFAIMAPQVMLGFYAEGGAHLVGLGTGNIHGGSTRDGVRLYWKFNDMIRMELQALDPDSDPTGTSVITVQNNPAPGVTITATESNAIPRFDLALPITVGNFVIEPSFTWSRQEFDGTEAGDDDSFDALAAAVGIKAGFGPVILGGEFTYGKNLGGSNYVGAAFWTPTAYDADGDADLDSIEDTTGYAWWFHIGFKLGPATIFGIIGNNNTDNDGSPVANDAAEFDVSRWMYGVSVPISVAKGFTVRPEFMYFDMDDSAQIGGVNNIDLGSEWLLGVQFMLAF